ncbi:hypothetical protein BD809_102279 [Aquimarina intermedia]|uniref:Histidine kinase N-terminal 7TM region domain-containing protein n=2 Tax=Aquimarina intermedia TaxID=350814 RepID=A0A5S5C9I1_9FLAO|nr:hypothetical protein BD809_102279 [Aquimarina intermedia]
MYIGMSFELITAIVGAFYLKSYKNKSLKYFIIFIWYTFINEIFTGIYLKRHLKIEEADILYNLYYLVYFFFYFYLFRNSISSRKYKLTINIFLYIYLISLIFNGFFMNYFTEIQILPHVIASSCLIVAIVFYYIEVLKSERVLKIEKSLLFWISIGVLVYSIGLIPFRILRNYYTNLVDDMVPLLATFILTIFMNTCFIIGFTWSDKKQLY